ncbi:MAG TPA: Ig domain-containing protein [Gaiellaceae bacterium]|nr:Ig domain-containing protein [Gaiellaceae bacterium]
MSAVRLASFAVVLSLPLFFAAGASALDLCEEPHCQPPPGEQNTFYEWEFEAEEGCVPYFFKHINGALPAGLAVTDNGELEGTPTEAGKFDFWVTLNDNGGPHNPACIYKGAESQAHFFLTILPDLAVTTETLPAARPGQPYSAQLQFSNPEAGWPVKWQILGGALPSGLTLSESGVISGTPTGVDTRTFKVRAAEGFRRFGDRDLTLTVSTALTASSALRAGEVGLRYTGRIPATGGVPPLRWSVAGGALPRGLTLDGATGAVRGVPRAAGSFGVAFAVTDAAGQSATVPANMRIAARLTVATRGLPAARAGAAYRARLASRGGVAPKTWRIVAGALPRGVRLDAATGTLTGTALETGVFRFTVEARDRLGARSRQALRLTVTG